jgi:hypothetical protein
MDVGIGLSTDKDPLQATREAAQRAKLDLRIEEAHLAVIFSSAEFAHPGTCRTISGIVGPVPIVGCSSAAIIANQGIFTYGILVALLRFPKDIHCNIASVKDIKTGSAVDLGQQLGEKLLYGFQGVRRDLAMVLSDRLLDEGQGLIYGLQERLGKSFPLVGASISKNPHALKSHLYFNNEVTSDAAIGLMWGGKTYFGLGLQHGWKPIGKPRRVTKATGNIVYEIDSAPASSLYEKYLACDRPALYKDLKRIAALYPIGMHLAGQKEYILRNIVSVQDDGSIVFQGPVPLESQIRFMISTKESCLEATRLAAEETKKALLGRQIDFAFVFESLVRYRLLGRETVKELALLKETLGQHTPIVGICTHGEQAPLSAIGYQGQAYFHNHSIAIVAMGSQK